MKKEEKYYLISEDDLSTYGDSRGSTKTEIEALLQEQDDLEGFVVIKGRVVSTKIKKIVVME